MSFVDDAGQELAGRHIAAYNNFKASSFFEKGTLFVKDFEKRSSCGAYTYWNVTCGACRETYSSTSNDLNSGKVKCKCGAVQRGKDRALISQFKATGSFAPKTNFKRLTPKSTLWIVHCPQCDQTYNTTVANLRVGRKRCYCAVQEKELARSLRKAERELARELATPEAKVPLRKTEAEYIAEFIKAGWNKRTKFELIQRGGGQKMRWSITCPECGDTWESQTSNLLNRHCGCSCQGKNLTVGYINEVVDGDTTLAIKFGIAADAETRCRVQDRKCIYSVRPLLAYRFKTTAQCRAAESFCKERVERGIISKEDMPDGYTETTYPRNLERIESIFRKYGGVKI